ncbi:MAG: hypothetical protein U5L01_13700 [Rheinheimera sp.]|nr:hypothetical protein [Rheinheimera sp.]
MEFIFHLYQTGVPALLCNQIYLALQGIMLSIESTDEKSNNLFCLQQKIADDGSQSCGAAPTQKQQTMSGRSVLKCADRPKTEVGIDENSDIFVVSTTVVTRN